MMKLIIFLGLMGFIASCSDDNNPLGRNQGIQDNHCPAGVENCEPAKLVVVSDIPVVFAPTTIGSTSVKQVVIENTGGFDAGDMRIVNVFAPFAFTGGSYPGIGGDCGAVLAVNAQCTLELEFVPFTQITSTSMVTVNYLEDPQVRNTLEIPVSGVSSNPSALVISDGPVFNFGTVVLGSTQTKTFTITNPSAGNATGFLPTTLGSGFSYAGGSYPGTSGTCASSLAAGQSCTVSISLSPTSVGPMNVRLSIDYFNGSSTLSLVRDIIATVNYPAMLVNSNGSSYNFGPTAVSSMNKALVAIVNTGGTIANNLTGGSLAAPYSYVGGVFPGANGNCTTTLNVGSSCLVEVAYTPSAVGTDSSSLVVNYNDGVANQSLTTTLTGNGSANAVLGISDGLTFNFGSASLTTTVTKTFTVTNSGATAATLVNASGISAPFSYTGGVYPGTGGDCTTTIASGASCFVEVSFTPISVGVVNSSIVLNYNDGATALSVSRPISGSGQGAAQLTISDSPVFDFGVTPVGFSKQRSFIVTNSGGSTAQSITSAALALPMSYTGGSYPGIGGSCGATLGIGASCIVNVSYQPTSTGSVSENLTISYNDSVSTQTTTRVVQGDAVMPASLVLSGAPLVDFGQVAAGTSVPSLLTLANNGGVDAALVTGGVLPAPFSYTGGAFPGSGGNCTGTLSPSASCTIDITAAPTTSSLVTGILSIQYQDGNGSQTTSRNLKLTGVAAAILQISDGPTFDYGTLSNGSVMKMTFTVENIGGVAATSIAETTLNGSFAFSGNNYPGTAGTCGTSLAVAANCTIEVEYRPSVVTSDSGNITLSYFDAVSSSTVARPLMGTSVTPGMLTISDGPNYSFGEVVLGDTSTKTFTIINGGNFTASSMAVGGLSGDYSFVGGAYPGTGGDCGATLAPSASCMVVVSYTPSATGLEIDALDLSYFDGTNNMTASRIIDGEGVNPAVLTITESPLFQYGLFGNGSTESQFFTVENTGGTTATALNISGLAAPFAVTGGVFPGSGASCASSLLVGAQCTIRVDFSPTAAGIHTDAIDLNYNDGVATQTTSGNIEGSSEVPAVLTLSDGPTYDFGNVAFGSINSKTITLSHSAGGMDATSITDVSLSSPFRYKGGSFPGTGGSCSAALTPSTNCTLDIEYVPTSTGFESKPLEVEYDNGTTTQSVSISLQGTANAPAILMISDGLTYTFDEIAVGSTTTHTFSVSNSAASPATAINMASLNGNIRFLGGAYPGTGGTCGATLNPSAVCQLVVEFAPTTVSTFSDTLTLNYFDGAINRVASRDIEAESKDPALIEISDAPTFDFGLRANGSVTSKTFTLTNSGGIDATSLSTVALANSFSFLGLSYPGVCGTCGNTLAASASCTVIIEYTPVATGSNNETITVNYQDGVAANTSTRSIQGASGSPAVLEISEMPFYAYGETPLNISLQHIFTVTNNGAIPATVISSAALATPYSYVGGSYPGTNGDCGTVLAASASCALEVGFNPSVQNSFVSQLMLTYDNGALTSSVNRIITGDGKTNANIEISDGPSVYSYADTSTGSVTSKTFTLTNTGGFSASGVNAATLTAPFVFVGGSYPGTGGSCGVVITSGSSCTINVDFSPTASGSFTDTLTINYQNGSAAASSTRDVAGNASTPASLSVSDAPSHDFGLTTIGNALTKLFTVTNNGDSDATSLIGTGLASPYQFTGGAFPGTGGDCGSTLAGSASCLVEVEFNPSSIGSFNDSLVFQYNDGATSQSVSRDLLGEGETPANIEISDGAVFDYGIVGIGAVEPKVFTLTNSGSGDATAVSEIGLATPFAFAGGAFPGTGGTCATTIAGGSNCTVVIDFIPTAAIAESDTIEFEYNNGSGLVSSLRNVEGLGAVAANLQISDSPTYDYGDVSIGGLGKRVFTITNTGGAAATSVTVPAFSSGFGFSSGVYPGTSGDCGTTLNAGATCTVEVDFVPSVVGAATSALQVNYQNAVSAANVSITLEANALTPANIQYSDAPSYDFGARSIGSSNTRTITLTNSGQTAATAITPVALIAPYQFLGGAYPGTGADCGAALAAAATCTVIVDFSPTVSGTQVSSLEVSYQSGAGLENPSMVLSGTGTQPANLVLSQTPSFDYGVHAVGSVQTQTFTLTNNGGIDATAILESTLVAPFVFTGGVFPGTSGTCKALLPNGSNCILEVEYAPTASGPNSGNLTIGYNNGTNTQSIVLPISGTAQTVADLVVSDSPSYDFGPNGTGSLTSKILTVTNNGEFEASSLSGTGLIAPFSFFGGSFPGSGGTCAAKLAGAASCTIVVDFSPIATGNFSDDVELSFYDGLAIQSVTRTLEGEGVGPALIEISDGPIFDFGANAIGSSTQKAFTFTNNGGVDATSIAENGNITGHFSFLGGSYPGTGGTCGSTLAPAASCSVMLSYDPLAPQSDNGNLSISYDDSGSTQTASRFIVATALNPALLVLSPVSPYDFGTVAQGSSNTFTLLVSNSGGAKATSIAGLGLAAPFNYFGGAYPGSGGTCAAVLPATSSCTIILEYAPTNSAVHTGTLDLGYQDGANTQTESMVLDGAADAPANLVFSHGSSFDFGITAIASNQVSLLTITNNGGSNATALSSVALAAPFSYLGGSYPGIGGSCVSSLAVSASCSIAVEYTPSSSIVSNELVSIDYNNGASVVSVSSDLMGTGATPAVLSINESPKYDFSTVGFGTTTDYTLTVSNSGEFEATALTDTGLLSSGFEFSGGTYPGTGGDCGVTLAASSSCDIVVSFVPTATGFLSDSIQIDYFDGTVTQSVSRDVEGTSQPPAVLTISDAVTYDYGLRAVGSITSYTFTVSNANGLSASSMVGSGLIGAFEFSGGSYPGAGGTCGASLPPAGTCTVVVDFLPTNSINYTGTFDITYNDGTSSVTASRPVTGDGSSIAVLEISDGPTYDFGNVAVGSKPSKSFTVSNTGGIEATSISGVSLGSDYQYVGGTYPGTGGSCNAQLVSGSTCTLIVEFEPTASGTLTTDIDLSYDNGLTITNSLRPLTAIAQTPADLEISDAVTYDFGNTAVGGVTSKLFTVTNNGEFTATGMISSLTGLPYLFTGGAFPGTNGDCGSSLVGGGACLVEVSFRPTAAGTFTDEIVLDYASGVGLAGTTRPLTGLASSRALLSFSNAPTLDFGDVTVGLSANAQLTVTNSGAFIASNLVYSALSPSFEYAGGIFPGTTGDCTTTLAVGASCILDLEFVPTADDSYSNILTVDYDDGVATQQITRFMLGDGHDPASLVISNGPTFDFGALILSQSDTKVFTVSNVGGSDAKSVVPTLAGPDFVYTGGAFPGTNGTCGTTIVESQSCFVEIEYSPSASGTQVDTFDLSYNNGVNARTESLAIQGTANTVAVLAIDQDPEFDYGIQATSSAIDQIFVLTNSGQTVASNLSGAGLSAPFGFKGGAFPGVGGSCGASLAGGVSCNVVVTFNPTSNGLSNSTINVSYSDGLATQSLTRNVKGTGADPAVLSIDQGPFFDYGRIVNGTTKSQIFTITHTGGVDATELAETGVAAPFQYVGGSFPGTNGDCAAVLAVGATCTLEVEYAPTASASDFSQVQLAYNDGATMQNISRVIRGDSGTAALLEVSSAPTHDFGTIATGAFVDAVLTVTNSGENNATTLSAAALTAPIFFTGGNYPGTGGDCGVVLNAGASCSLVVRFAPSASGLATQTLTLDYNDGAASAQATRDLQGTGANPAAISISDGPVYDYGSVSNGSVSSKVFTLTNTGGVDATAISDIGLGIPFRFGGGVFPGTAGDCGVTLAVGASCFIDVVFAPTNTGTFSDSIEISFNDGVTTQSSLRAVQGISTSPALVEISNGPFHDFSNIVINQTSDVVLTLTNTGGTDATSMNGEGLSGNFNFKGGTYPGTGGDCGGELAINATCDVVVEFAPVTVGGFSDVLEVSYDDGVANATADRIFIGNGVPVAQLEISNAPTFNFGDVVNTDTSEQILTVTNVGGFVAETISGYGLAAPFAFRGGSYPGSGGTCGGNLGAGASCTIVVTFTPSTSGTFTDTVSLDYSDGSSTLTADRGLEGVGESAALITISESPSYDFGDSVLQVSNAHTFTVTNSGGFEAKTMTGVGLNLHYAFLGGSYPGTGGTCGATLAGNNTSCSVVVEFIPQSTGPHFDTIEINYNDGLTVQQATRNIEGNGQSPATLTISDAAIYDYGLNGTDVGNSKTFTVTQGGDVDATAIASNTLTVPYQYLGGSYPGTGGDCGTTLAVGSTCAIVVDFNSAAAGVFTETIELSFSDGFQTQTTTRDLTGEAIEVAVLEISDGPTFDYGRLLIASENDKTFTVSNTGGFDATTISEVGLAAPYAFKGSSFPGAGGTCGTTIAPGANCTIVVTYTPELFGVESDTIDFSYFDGIGTQNSDRSITGEGFPGGFERCITLAPVAIDAGYQVKVELSMPSDYANISATGDDISFYDNANVKLDFYTQVWDPSGTSTFWVQVKAAGTNEFCMYYGNTNLTGQSDKLAMLTSDSLQDLYFQPRSSGNNFLFESYTSNNEVNIPITTGSGIENLTLTAETLSSLSNPAEGIVQANGPITGRIDNASGFEEIIPLTLAGTKFGYSDNRYTPRHWHLYNPNDSASTITINYYNATGVLQDTTTDVVNSKNPITIDYTPNHDVAIVDATLPVVGMYYGGVGDSTVLVDADTELIGITGGRIWITGTEDATTCTIFYSDNTSESCDTDKGERIGYESGTQGNGVSAYIESDKPVIAITQADGDGGESFTFLPKRHLDNEYLIPTESQYLSVASTEDGQVITVTDPDGSPAPISGTTVLGGAKVAKLYFGSTANTISFSAGTKITSDKPFFVYYEYTSQDETTKFGPVSARVYQHPASVPTLGTENPF